jgi:hypothetical protein
MSTSTEKNDVTRIFVTLSWVSAVVAVVATIVFFAWWGLKDRIAFGDEKFDKVAWITASSSSEKSCHRGDMAFDLQQHVLQAGITREEATSLLGRPSWEEAGQMEYDLGNCMHVIHGLRLFFNENNQLTHSRIVQH